MDQIQWYILLHIFSNIFQEQSSGIQIRLSQPKQQTDQMQCPALPLQRANGACNTPRRSLTPQPHLPLPLPPQIHQVLLPLLYLLLILVAEQQQLFNQCCQMEYRKFLEIWGQNFSRNEKKSGDSQFHFGILLPVIGS